MSIQNPNLLCVPLMVSDTLSHQLNKMVALIVTAWENMQHCFAFTKRKAIGLHKITLFEMADPRSIEFYRGSTLQDTEEVCHLNICLILFQNINYESRHQETKLYQTKGYADPHTQRRIREQYALDVSSHTVWLL